MTSRTSALSILAFLGGLATAMVAFGAWVTLWVAQHPATLGLPVENARHVYTGARVAAFCTLAPALCTAIFWLLARGAVRESQGQVHGKSLYRVGFVLAILGVCAALAGRNSIVGRSMSGQTRVEAGGPFTEEDRRRLALNFRALVTHRISGNARAFSDLCDRDVIDRVAVEIVKRPIEGEIDASTIQVMSVAEARERLKGTWRWDQVLWSGPVHDDAIVFAPSRFDAATTKSFLGGEEEGYVYYFFRRERGRWKALMPAAYARTESMDYGGLARRVCPEKGCAELDWNHRECPRHGTATRERWYVCEHCWVRSSVSRKCPRCRRDTIPIVR